MRMGLIGTGRIGAFHARVLRDLPGVSGVAVTDVDPGRAAAVAEELGLDVAVDAMALADSVDALVIAAATEAHAELLHLAADAGLPAFCEKPIALDLDVTARVVDHVSASGIPVQMGFQRRFDAGFRRAQQAVASGGLGKLYLLRAAMHDPAPPPEDYLAISGGIFRDMHIHDFDSLRFVTGQEVTEVFAYGSVLGGEMFSRYGDVDTTAVAMRFDGGAMGVLTGARHDPLGYDIRLELFGSEDSIAVGMDAGTPLRTMEPGASQPAGPRHEFFMDRFGSAYRAEMEAFLDVAKGNRPSPCTVTDAQAALRIAVAAGCSRVEHRPVRVEEAA